MNQKHKHYLLTVLMKECGEVVQAASKVIRFGAHAYGPETTETNAETLTKELGDLYAMMEMIQQYDDFRPVQGAHIREKKNRVLSYMKQACGEEGVTGLQLLVDPEELIRVRTEMIEGRKRYLNGES